MIVIVVKKTCEPAYNLSLGLFWGSGIAIILRFGRRCHGAKRDLPFCNLDALTPRRCLLGYTLDAATVVVLGNAVAALRKFRIP